MAPGQAGHSTLNSSGPVEGEEGVELTKIKGKILSSITGVTPKEESIQAQLQFPDKSKYDGKWLVGSDNHPVLKFVKNTSDVDTILVHLNLNSTSAGMNFAYAGYFLKLTSITQGQVNNSSELYKVDNGDAKSSESEAKSQLGTSVGGGSLSLTKDGITATNNKAIIEGDGSFKVTGNSSSREEHVKNTSQSGTVEWTSTDNVTSSVSGEVTVKWVFALYKQVKVIRHMYNGSVKTISDTGWVETEKYGEDAE